MYINLYRNNLLNWQNHFVNLVGTMIMENPIKVKFLVLKDHPENKKLLNNLKLFKTTKMII